ncbi:hypothetical protein BX600DRAFT_4906 [Xylariales sp. PMI_506]|nr:hypothetical protein BX600DRAFT_4906 [Xylariales sp. PMI_506]
MKDFSGMMNEVFDSFSYTVSRCCGWSDETPQYESEKRFVVLHDQPSYIPPPLVEAMPRQRAPYSTWEPAPRRKHGSGFSVRRRLFTRTSSSASRWPPISAPSNFVHVSSGSYAFPRVPEPRRRPNPQPYRPLQLSIYECENQLTPILPHFDSPNPLPITPPQRAITHQQRSPSTYTPSYAKSSPSMSFHLPRKSVSGGSVFDSPRSDVVQRPSPARVRAYTSAENGSPGMDDLIERIANAMLERDRLQDKIDEVERQSIYLNSRPSTAASMRPRTALSMMDMEPMPEVPALPPDAPSFSERLSFDRPTTAPAKPPIQMQQRVRALSELQQGGAYSPTTRRTNGQAPPPPLPLRLRPPLRPPLRKKKSFSRVSSWLGFPADIRHSREVSIDSITNKPMPVQAGDGFYQVAEFRQKFATQRSSFESDETVSEWTSDAEVEEDQTVPTSCSPSSSATVRPIDPARNVVLGQVPQEFQEFRHSRVGVAF